MEQHQICRTAGVVLKDRIFPGARCLVGGSLCQVVAPTGRKRALKFRQDNPVGGPDSASEYRRMSEAGAVLCCLEVEV